MCIINIIDSWVIRSDLKAIKDAEEEVGEDEFKDGDESSLGGDEVPLPLLLPVHLRQGGVVLGVRPGRGYQSFLERIQISIFRIERYQR